MKIAVAGCGAVGSYYTSPVAASGRIYVASVNGVLSVIQAGDKPEVIAASRKGRITLEDVFIGLTGTTVRQ